MGPYDLVIVGGGVNGCGVARDAAGRGLSTFLCDKGDIGGATSSASTKLIHGGLRYLEGGEFRLVREALAERETLLRIAPHLIRPMRFVLPHDPGGRSWLALRLGVFIYDRLGGPSRLPKSRGVDLAQDEAGSPLIVGAGRALEYSDCWVDDSRLVLLNALDAAERGATIAPRVACVAAAQAGGLWRLTLEREGGERFEIAARNLVNAAGPWVSAFLEGPLGRQGPAEVRLVRGSHIVVPRLFNHDRAYIFQQADRRVVFAIPYERDFTLIGTTDVDHGGAPDRPRIAEFETAYLCAAANARFRRQISPDDVAWSYSGVRPLHDDGTRPARQATRDYVVELDAGDGRAPLLSIYGGKITTYRRLAETVLERLSTVIPAPGRPWTDSVALPGGDLAPGRAACLPAELVADFPFLDRADAERLCRAYGLRAWTMLEGARSRADLGMAFGAGLSEREVCYLMEREWARNAGDVLWRRTKLGLRVSEAERASLESFMEAGSL